MRLYGERERGGRGGRGGAVKNRRNQDIENFRVQDRRGGAVFYQRLPSAPPTSNYYQRHRSGGARPQAPGCPVGQSQGRPTRHWLDPVGRRAASEGSLSLTVASSLDTEQIRRGGEGRGEHEHAGKGGGGGSGQFTSAESGGDKET